MGFTLLIILSQRLNAQASGAESEIQNGFATKGTKAVYAGLNGFPSSLGLGYAGFAADRVALSAELNIGRTIFDGYQTSPYSRVFLQPGLKCNLHILKHSVFDPYFNIGLHAPLYITQKKDTYDYLYDILGPGYISIGVGGRLWLSEHFGLYNEYAVGNGLIKLGIIIKN